MKHICPNAGILESCKACYHSHKHEPKPAGIDDDGKERTECDLKCGGTCFDKFMPCKTVYAKEAVNG